MTDSNKANVNGGLEPELIERLKTEFVERMAKARERQKQVLIERGLLTEEDERRLSAPIHH